MLITIASCTLLFMFASNKHVSNLCPRQGAGGVLCCARFISNKKVFLFVKKIILKTVWRSPIFLLLSWNTDSCASAHPAVNEWGGMKLGQSSTYYPRIWIAVSSSTQRCMGGEDYRTVIPKAEEDKSFCDEVFPNSPIAELSLSSKLLLRFT